MSQISWTGGEPKVEIVHLGWFKGYRILYGPQILGFRNTFWGATRLAKRAKRQVASR